MKTTIFGLVCGIALVAGPVSATAALPQAATVKTSDHTLTERIETRVRQDAALKKHNVKVTVDAGVATLTGTVASAAEKTRAAQLARVNGITRVDNQLVVDRSVADAVAQGTKGTVAETKEAARAAGEAAKEAGGKAKEGAVKVGEKARPRTRRRDSRRENQGWRRDSRRENQGRRRDSRRENQGRRQQGRRGDHRRLDSQRR